MRTAAAPTSRKLSPSAAGYTLFELMAILVVLGVSASLVLPGEKSTSHYRLDLAAEQTASALRFARSEALRRNASFGVQVDAAGGKLRVFRVDESASPPATVFDVRHPRSRNPYDLTFDEAGLIRGVAISNASTWNATCVQSASLAFDEAGVPRCIEPYATVMSSFDITLSVGGQTATVSVAAETGRVVGP